MGHSRSDLLFADNFDLPAQDAVAPPSPPVEPPPPPLEQADLDAAAARGHDEGYSQGRSDAAAERGAAVALALARIAELLATATQQAESIAEASADGMCQMLVAAISAGYPLLRARYGDAEVRDMIRTLRKGMERETRVTIFVHSDHVAGVDTELAVLPRSARLRMTVEPSDDMLIGDVRIEWPDGAAIRDVGGAWDAIAEVLGPLGLLPPATTQVVAETPEAQRDRAGPPATPQPATDKVP